MRKCCTSLRKAPQYVLCVYSLHFHNLAFSPLSCSLEAALYLRMNRFPVQCKLIRDKDNKISWEDSMCIYHLVHLSDWLWSRFFYYPRTSGYHFRSPRKPLRKRLQRLFCSFSVYLFIIQSTCLIVFLVHSSIFQRLLYSIFKPQGKRWRRNYKGFLVLYLVLLNSRFRWLCLVGTGCIIRILKAYSK